MGFADTYAPLRLLNQSPDSYNEFNILMDGFKKAGCKGLSDITEDEFIHFCMSDNFFDPMYDGKYESINNTMIETGFVISQEFGLDKNYFKKVNMVAEMRDTFVGPILMSRWGKNKQVYKPDKDFADALLTTENLELTKYMLEHLPCNDIYVDLTDCEKFRPIDGFLMHVITEEDRCSIAIYLLQQTDKDVIFFSYYTDGIYDDKNIIRLDIKQMLDFDIDKDFDVFPNLIDQSNMDKNYGLNRAHMSLFGLQLLAYLSSKEPQIEENKITKNTYRKPNSSFKPKNKFSEIQMWDIGCKYGNLYRQKVKQIKEGGFVHHRKEGRKSPIPHFRRAHWQSFWVGRGRVNRIIKWIEPTFVNGDMSKDVNITSID